MYKILSTLVLLVSLAAPAAAAPVVTLGPPVTDSFSTVDPGSIQVEMLDAGDFVDLQISITIHPFCFRPIEMDLVTSGDGGTFANQTGNLVNDCGGDTSVFDIRLTGDGVTHVFDIAFVDVDTGVPIASIPVTLSPGAAPVITLGPPVTDSLSTVDPGSIRIDMFGAGDIVDLQLSITIHPFCIRPFDIDLTTTGDGGTFANQTGVLENGCGGQTSAFDIRLSGDGLAHTFDIEFVDVDSGGPLTSIPVTLNPGPAPVVTLGPPVMSDLLTVDPGSIRVEMLGAGVSVDLQVSMTVHPFCIVPIDVGLGTTGDGGTFTDFTGALVNGCGGDTSVFDIRLTGDGLAHAFDIDFLDLNAGVPLVSIPVELYPGVADTDSDGITDLSDNCIESPNTNQRDTDADRIGNACDPDIASPNDCLVNFADLSTLKDAFFATPADLQWNPDADFNGDDRVNFADLDVMKSAFFGPPGPSANGCN